MWMCHNDSADASCSRVTIPCAHAHCRDKIWNHTHCHVRAHWVTWTAQIYTVAIVKAGMPPSAWIFLLIVFQFNSDIVTGKPQKCRSQHRLALIVISIKVMLSYKCSYSFRSFSAKWGDNNFSFWLYITCYVRIRHKLRTPVPGFS